MKRLNINLEKKQECSDYAWAFSEINLKQLSAHLGIGHSSLSQWVMQARQKGFVGSERALTPEQQRIKALEKENAHLREVNEIIKKAHVYFVNHPSR